jgi:hypothetical protein
MPQENLYDWQDDQACAPQPEPAEETVADKFVRTVDERVRKGQELTRIILANLKGQP